MKLILVSSLIVFFTTTLSAQTFYKNDRGCIVCEDAKPGDTGVVDGVTYTAVDRAMLEANIQVGKDLTKVCVSLVTDMSKLFYWNESFNQPIGNWDVSHVSNMSEMFAYASNFNQPIGNWDVSKVTNMYRTLFFAHKFNQPIGNWDVSKVTNMSGMFRDAYVFDQPIGTWNTKNVTNMSDMFRHASVFNQPIGDWDVGNVTNMKEMFFWALKFNQPIGNWDVSSVITTSDMFYSAKNYNQPMHYWELRSATNLTRMFTYASSFNQYLDTWCVPNIKSEPTAFAYGTPLLSSNMPIWGTCPELIKIRFDYLIITPIETSDELLQKFQFFWSTQDSITQTQVFIQDSYGSEINDTLVSQSTFLTPFPFQILKSYQISIRGYYQDGINQRRGYWFGSVEFGNSIDTSTEQFLPIGNKEEFKLSPNYPNPFNPSTQIPFSLAKSGHVTLEVFTILGANVATLVNEEKPAGEYSIPFNAKNLASGVYLYRLTTSEFSQTRLMNLVK